MKLNLITIPKHQGRGNPLAPQNSGAPAADPRTHPIVPDQGCQYSPSCLACPLPVCKHDRPNGQHPDNSKQARDLAAASMILSQNLTAQQAAERLGVTVRTVYRILSRARESQIQPTKESSRP